MTLSDVAIRRPVLTLMMSMTLLVLGFLGYSRLGTDLYPSATVPVCQVVTVYPGAGPADIESLVTRPIEDAAAGISGMDRIFSQSRENASVVLLQFKMSVPFGEAVQQVRDRVNAAQASLPPGTQTPIISQFDINAQPVVVFTASSNGDPLELHDLLDKRVRPRLENLAGVAAARLVGGNQREVLIDLDPVRLRAMQIPPEMIVQRLRAKSIELPAGHYIENAHELNIRVSEAFKDSDSVRNLVLAAGPGGHPITLGDIATVRDAAAESRTMVRTNGRVAMAIEIIKQAGANTVDVAHAVRQELEALHTDLGEAFVGDILIDQSIDIEANTHEVWLAIYFGGAMAILIILLFLMDWRGTVISALALPTSVIGTLFAMWWLGFTLNQLTLLALSLAIGLLIDDAVVVRESITKRLEAGEDPASAASQGTREIALAVMATTFTLCAVFTPVAFMRGIVGQFFRQFGLTMTAAVLISLFIAFTLDPMLSARFIKPRQGHDEKPNAVVGALKRFFEGLEAAYSRSLGWVLEHKVITLLAALVIFVASLAVGKFIGNDFLGSEDRAQVIVKIDFPPGTRLVTAAERSGKAEALVRAMPGVSSVYAVVGVDEQVEKISWRVLMVPKTQRDNGLAYYKTEIRKILGQVPEAKFTVTEAPLVDGMGDWPPVLMRVTGPDLAVLQREANFLAEALRHTHGAVDVQVNDSPARSELRVKESADPGVGVQLPAAAVGMQLRLATMGQVIGKLRGGAHEADIRVRLAETGWGSRDAIGRLPVWGPKGVMSLSDAAVLDTMEAPSIIEHENRVRQIAVTANLETGADLGSVTESLSEELKKHKLEPGYAYVWSGQQREMADMVKDFAQALALAVVFIYIVLACQFESLIHPFTIMLALPFALVGALLGLALGGYHLAIGAYIGVILLMGLVTKNSILLVDGALQRVQAGDNALTAMRYAGPRRLRPILMTSAAMVLGMLPTALGHGTGSEFRAPMAVAIIGGVLVSTLLTLWVVPAMFVSVERLR